MGDGKGYIILLPGHPVVIAGMGHRIDAIGKPDINHTLVYIGYFSGILALDSALLEIVPVGVFRCALDVGTDSEVLKTVAPHIENADQHFIAHGETLVGIANPIPSQITGQNGGFNAEHLDTDDLLRNSDNSGLNNTPLVDAVLPLGVQIEIKGLALPHHRGRRRQRLSLLQRWPCQL